MVLAEYSLRLAKLIFLTKVPIPNTYIYQRSPKICTFFIISERIWSYKSRDLGDNGVEANPNGLSVTGQNTGDKSGVEWRP